MYILRTYIVVLQFIDYTDSIDFQIVVKLLA